MAELGLDALVRERLAGYAAVASLAGARIYPVEAPDKAALPLIVYGVQLAEPAGELARVNQASVAVHCYAHSDAGAQALAQAATSALENWSGTRNGAMLGPLVLESWAPARDFELNLWGRLLSFGAVLRR